MSWILALAFTVPTVTSSCRWQPEQLEAACVASSYGEKMPHWEVTDTTTGEVLHRARGVYVRITLSETRWRDVLVRVDGRGSAKVRLRWTKRGRLESLPVAQ